MKSSKKSINEANTLHTTRNGVKAFGAYDGDIIVDNNGAYILKVSLEFNTPSGASDFVLGGSTNGWIEWKNSEAKKLL